MRTRELGASRDDSGVVCTPRSLIGKCLVLASESTSHSIQNMENFELAAVQSSPVPDLCAARDRASA